MIPLILEKMELKIEEAKKNKKKTPLNLQMEKCLIF